MKQKAQIEYFSHPEVPYALKDSPIENKENLRVKVFVLTFLVSLIIGISINYSRPAVYLSNATLLTSAATAVDQQSQKVDFQHVTIQRQKLLGAELLTKTITRIKLLDNELKVSDLSLVDVRNMLQVKPIEETNLLNMTAKGPEPELLPVVINTWIDVYLEARANNVKSAANNTVERIENELIELDNKIETTRKDIDMFRKEHDISSITREENELPATLISLTKALNNANERVVISKAKLDAVNQAIAAGRAVVPQRYQTGLTGLEKEYRKLTGKMAEFDKHFTRDYLQYKGSMKYIPERIKELKKQIKLKRRTGKGIVRTEASQEYYAAKQVVEKIRKQLDKHKIKATKFTALFSKHQKMIDDIESMELMTRKIQDRLVKIQSRQYDKYPQVDVVERASLNMQAISPDYKVGIYIVLSVSLFLAFFIVWLREFLLQSPVKDDPSAFDVPEATWFGTMQQNKEINQHKEINFIEQEKPSGLPQTLVFKKISNLDIQLLLKHADKNTQQLILLLLSGLNLEEISDLSIEQVDFELSSIQVLGQPSRTTPIGKVLQEKLNESFQDSTLWGEKGVLSVDEMNAMLYCSAVDIGLDSLQQPLADILRKSYIIYLVEQGVRLTALVDIVGKQTPMELASYAVYSPVGSGCSIDKIQLIYPLCD